MYKKFLAIVALGLFLSYFYFIGAQVEEAGALIAVLAAAGAMAVYDFWRDAFRNQPDKNNNNYSKTEKGVSARLRQHPQ